MFYVRRCRLHGHSIVYHATNTGVAPRIPAPISQPGHREQIVIVVTIPEQGMSRQERQSPDGLLLKFQGKAVRYGVVEGEAVCGHFCTRVLVFTLVTREHIVKKGPINYEFLRKCFPMQYLPFYRYNNEKEMAIDHVLIEAPSVQFSAYYVRIDETPGSGG